MSRARALRRKSTVTLLREGDSPSIGETPSPGMIWPRPHPPAQEKRSHHLDGILSAGQTDAVSSKLLILCQSPLIAYYWLVHIFFPSARLSSHSNQDP